MKNVEIGIYIKSEICRSYGEEIKKYYSQMGIHVGFNETLGDAISNCSIVIMEVQGLTMEEKKMIGLFTEGKEGRPCFISLEERMDAQLFQELKELSIFNYICTNYALYEADHIIEGSWHKYRESLKHWGEVERLTAALLKSEQVVTYLLKDMTNPVLFNIGDLVSEIGECHTNKAVEKNIKFRVYLDEKIPKWLKGDVYKIKRFLYFMVSNAIACTEYGYVHLHVDLMDTYGDKSRLQFLIKDSGSGNSVKDSSMAIDISKRVIQALGGKFKMETLTQIGSQISVEIPLESALMTAEFELT